MPSLKSRLRRLEGTPRKVVNKVRYLGRKSVAYTLLAVWTGLLAPVWIPGWAALALRMNRLAERCFQTAVNANQRTPGVLRGLVVAQVRQGKVVAPVEHALRLDRLRQAAGELSRRTWDEYLLGVPGWLPVVDLPKMQPGATVLVLSRLQPAGLPAACTWLPVAAANRPARYAESTLDVQATAMAATSPTGHAVFAIARDPQDLEIVLVAAALAEWAGVPFGVQLQRTDSGNTEAAARRSRRLTEFEAVGLAEFAGQWGVSS